MNECCFCERIACSICVTCSRPICEDHNTMSGKCLYCERSMFVEGRHLAKRKDGADIMED